MEEIDMVPPSPTSSRRRPASTSQENLGNLTVSSKALRAQMSAKTDDSRSKKKWKLKWGRKDQGVAYDKLLPSKLLSLFFQSMTYLGISIDLAFCAIYIVERNHLERLLDDDESYPFYITDRPAWIRWTLLALTIAALGTKLFRAPSYRLHDLIVSLFSFDIIIDVITLVPIFVVVANVGILGNLFYPYFLRCWTIRPQLKMLFQTNGGNQENLYDPLTEKIFSLVATLMSFALSFVCFFNWAETGFSHRITLWRSFYYFVVTISTVGYGDISPSNTISQIVVVVLILMVLVFLPGQVSQLVEALKIREMSGGKFSSRDVLYGKKRHVLICANLLHGISIADVLNEFSPKLRGSSKPLHVVFLANHEASNTLKVIMQAPQFRGIVTYLVGSAANGSDLKRASIQTAEACFVLADPNDGHLHLSDQKNTFRVWSVRDLAPQIPLYVHSMKASTSAQFSSYAKVNTSDQMMKQLLIGGNALNRTYIPFVCNLFKQTNPFSDYTEAWMDQYGDGSGNEIYERPGIPKKFVGQPFQVMALDCFTSHQTLFFAVMTYLEEAQEEEEKRKSHLMLNPMGHILKADDICFFIAQDDSNIDAIYRESEGVDEEIIKAIEDIEPSDLRPSVSIISKGLTFFDTALYSKWEQDVYLGYLPSPFKDEPPFFCHILKKRKTRPPTLEDASDFRNHVLILANSLPPISLFHLVAMMRMGHLKKDELPEIVIATDEIPERKEWAHLANFPLVYYIKIDITKDQELILAGVKTAEQVIILSNPEDWNSHSSTDMTDANVVMVANKIKGLASENLPICCELAFRTNWKYIHPTSDTYDASSNILGYKYLLTPSYVCGNVLSPTLYEGLLFQTYFGRPNLVPLIQLLSGWKTKDSLELDRSLKINPSFLSTIEIPEAVFAESETATFGYLFLFLMKNFNIFALGIVRGSNRILQNKLPFPFTNPLPATPVIPKDRVLVLAPRLENLPSSLPDHQEPTKKSKLKPSNLSSTQLADVR